MRAFSFYFVCRRTTHIEAALFSGEADDQRRRGSNFIVEEVEGYKVLQLTQMFGVYDTEDEVSVLFKKIARAGSEDEVLKIMMSGCFQSLATWVEGDY